MLCSCFVHVLSWNGWLVRFWNGKIQECRSALFLYQSGLAGSGTAERHFSCDRKTQKILRRDLEALLEALFTFELLGQFFRVDMVKLGIAASRQPSFFGLLSVRARIVKRSCFFECPKHPAEIESLSCFSHPP